MKILNGAELAGFIKERQGKAVRGLKQASNIVPKLAIVQVKDDPVINTYVNLKQAYGKDIDVDVDIHFISQEDIASKLQSLNDDKRVHGVIVQLPLANPSKTQEVCNMVDPKKDVDALGDPGAPWSPRNSSLSAMQGKDERQTEAYREYDDGAPESLTKQRVESDSSVSDSVREQAITRRGSWFEPATPMAIMWLLAGYNVELKGKKILLIGRGKLVGAPLEKIFRTANHDVTVADRSTKNLRELSLKADVIITAAGSPAILFPDMLKSGAVVVDAGVASEEGRKVGDLAPEVYERDDLVLTPKKGGVGPLTVCALFENVLLAAHSQAAEKP